MTEPAAGLVGGLAGYLAGSLPWVRLVARAHGVDLVRAGDRNPRAVDLLRTAGRRAGVTVLVLDAGMGLVAAGVGLALGGWWIALLGTLAAMAGYAWPAWSRFRHGGRPVATLAGAGLALAPLSGIVSWGLFLLALPVLGFRAGSLVGVLSFPVFLVALVSDRLRLAGLGLAYLLLLLGNLGRRRVRPPENGAPLAAAGEEPPA